MPATVIAGPVKLKTTPPAPYSPLTRPHFLDIYWQWFLGGRFVSGQGTVQTSLSAPTTVGATSFTVADATGIVAGMPLILFNLAANVYTSYQAVLVSSVAGTTINLSTAVDRVFASGSSVYGMWLNDAHPNGYGSLAQWIADAKQRNCLGGTNLLPKTGNSDVPDATNYPYAGLTIGDFPSFTAQVPDGWQAVGSPVFLSGTDWSSSGAVFNQSARGGRTGVHGIDVRWNSGAGNGMGLVAAVPVTPGERITVTAFCKAPGQGGSSKMQVVDFTTPARVLGTYTWALGSGSRVGIPAVVSFVVPAGTTGIDVRFFGVTGDIIVSDVRVLRARQDVDQDRYVLEDPGDRPIVFEGDSWCAGLAGAASASPIAVPVAGTLPYSLATRLGRTPAMYSLGVSGNTIAQQLARFWSQVAPLKPAYYVHCSAFMNDSGRPLTDVLKDVATLLDWCRQIGTTPVLLGAANQNSAIVAMGLLQDNIRAAVDRNIDYVPWSPAAV